MAARQDRMKTTEALLRRSLDASGAGIALILALAIGCTGASPAAPGTPGPRYPPMVSPGVVFVPTPPDVGTEMLKLAGVGPFVGSVY
jgi:hypothetical protein